MTDDDKTTPTPAPGLDLDAVERATSGRGIAHANAAHRHAPVLIAEVRALRAKLAEAHSLLRSAGDLFVEIQATDGEDEHKAITDGAKLSAAIAAALEAL